MQSDRVVAIGIMPLGFIVALIVLVGIEIQKVKEGSMNSTPLTAQSFVVSGEIVNFGSSGELELSISSDGRFLQRIDSQISEIIAFDGNEGWITDPSGLVRVLSDVELAWHQLKYAVLANNWSFIEREFILESQESQSSGQLEVIEVGHQHGYLKAEITRDSKSGLAQSVRLLEGMFQEAMQLEDYREVDGVVVPTRLTHSVDQYEFRTVNLNSIEGSTSFSDEAFVVDKSDIDDYTFDPNISPEVEVMKTAMGHFLVRPIINGKQMGWFFLDTGASASAIASHVVQDLDLEEIGKFPILSIFGREERPVYKAKSLSLGPITIGPTGFVEMDLAQVNAALGIEVEGVIGFPLFARSIVEVDVSTDRVFIHDASKFNAGELEWQDFVLDFNHPVIKASFDGGEKMHFRFDIGAGQNTIIFHTHTVDDLNLLNNREVEEYDLGVGLVAFGHIEWVEVAGRRFENVQVGFSRTTEGPFADTNTAGNIGLGLLSNFKLVFDYQNARIAFVPVAN